MHDHIDKSMFQKEFGPLETLGQFDFDGLLDHPSAGEADDRAGLEVIQTHRPLGREDDPFDWVNEGTVSPWTIYELRRA